MLGKIVLGGVALCLATGVGVGWWLANRGAEWALWPRAEALAGEEAVPQRSELELVEPPARNAAEGTLPEAALASEIPQPDLAASVEPSAPAPLDVDALVAALHDDHVHWNATEALTQLLAAGEQARPALERALESTDEQQRALAACALALRHETATSPALARELLALLTPAPGQRLYGISARPWICAPGRADVDERLVAFHAFCASPVLFGAVEPEFEARLTGSDLAQRFDAARIILAHEGARSRGAAFDALLEHLADNALYDDAATAMRVLGAKGGEALPHVIAALPGRDRQAACLLAHLLSYLEPHHPAAQRLQPKELVRLGFYRGDMLAEPDGG